MRLIILFLEIMGGKVGCARQTSSPKWDGPGWHFQLISPFWLGPSDLLVHFYFLLFKLKIIKTINFSILYFCKYLNMQYYYNLNH